MKTIFIYLCIILLSAVTFVNGLDVVYGEYIVDKITYENKVDDQGNYFLVETIVCNTEPTNYDEFQLLVNIFIDGQKIKHRWLKTYNDKCDTFNDKIRDLGSDLTYRVELVYGPMQRGATYSKMKEITLKTQTEPCQTDADCDDNDPLSVDICREGSCSNIAVILCKDNDKACPPGCTETNDNDCAFECLKDSDCNDNDISTSDRCIDSECSFSKIQECLSGDDYCPSTCSYETDSDCPEHQCNTDEDCKDNNPCTIDTCQGIPKQCDYTIQDGCIYNSQCLEYGFTDSQNFCDFDGSIKELKTKGDQCEFSHECSTNLCINNECRKKGFFTGIKDWISSWFS